jgi:ubiquinone/menaquinone biosynthesis C-methylase UbiE
MTTAARALQPSARLLDIGCGAGRNAIPLSELGWRVVGTDLSRAMLVAAAARKEADARAARLDFVLAPMESLPFSAGTFDFIVAHGIWNLARSGSQFRTAVREAARVGRPGALLFVFTFSRHTLQDGVSPLAGEAFVFTEFSGEPQCFLTADQLVAELADAGFDAEPSHPLRELNRRDGQLPTRAPVIFEGLFRRAGKTERPERRAT